MPAEHFANAPDPVVEEVCKELCALYAQWINGGKDHGWGPPDMDPLSVADFMPNRYGERAVFRGLLEGSNGYTLVLTVNPYQDEGGPQDLIAMLDYDDGSRYDGETGYQQVEPPVYGVRIAYMDFDTELTLWYDARIPFVYGLINEDSQAKMEQMRKEHNPFVYNDTQADLINDGESIRPLKETPNE